MQVLADPRARGLRTATSDVRPTLFMHREGSWMLAFVSRWIGMVAMVVVISSAPGRSAGGDDGAHAFVFTAIDGTSLPLDRFRGKTLLVVNTASFCGFTHQYTDLQALWSRYEHRGLVVLGVPSNDFGGQEPGSEAEIKQFCEVNFDVDFPLTTKEHVVGPNAHPFYRWAVTELGAKASPRWNFHKFLVAPDGALIGHFPPTLSPTADRIVSAIEPHLRAPNE